MPVSQSEQGRILAIPSIIKELVPAELKQQIHAWRIRRRSTRNYEALYETQAQEMPPETSIGDGDYAKVGRLEMALLFGEGLKPGDTLVDFGCGTGRLALQIIPKLIGGQYIGIDISKTMIAHARQSVNGSIPHPPCAVDFRQQSNERFDVAPNSADMVCAFSVFTHMEHEDNYRYLRAIREIVKEDGMFIFSCLPMELELSKFIFRAQAQLDPVTRWAGVRNVTTTRQFMEELAVMAGWRVVRWLAGDEQNLRDPETGQMCGLGQSACVLRPA